MPAPIAAEPPLILTARLDPDAFAILDGLRGRWFPVELNKVPAHLSLFHHLPGDEIRTVLDCVHRACVAQTVILLHPLPPRFLGRGVAVAYASDRLAALRHKLAIDFAGWLTPQDRQPFKAHVTIQNKVSPETARTLLAEIAQAPSVVASVVGIDVWRYLGGPWAMVATVPFGVVNPHPGP